MIRIIFDSFEDKKWFLDQLSDGFGEGLIDIDPNGDFYLSEEYHITVLEEGQWVE